MTEDDAARQSIEDKNWGLKAEDDNDVGCIVLSWLYFISYRPQQSKGRMVLSFGQKIFILSIV